MADIAGRVIGVIAKTQHLSPENISMESTFDELKIDSLDGINLLFALENEFDIDIPDDEAKSIKSVKGMVEGIEKLLAAKSTASDAAPAQGAPGD